MVGLMGANIKADVYAGTVTPLTSKESGLMGKCWPQTSTLS